MLCEGLNKLVFAMSAVRDEGSCFIMGVAIVGLKVDDLLFLHELIVRVVELVWLGVVIGEMGVTCCSVGDDHCSEGALQLTALVSLSDVC